MAARRIEYTVGRVTALMSWSAARSFDNSWLPVTPGLSDCSESSIRDSLMCRRRRRRLDSSSPMPS